MENTIIGKKFKILKKIGNNGFWKTFTAENISFQNGGKYVVKQLSIESEEAGAIKIARELFYQKAEILEQVSRHEQVQSLTAAFEEGGELYLVQEFIEGDTLAEIMAQGRLFNFREVTVFTAQLLGILAFTHRKRVIHRAVKPSNIVWRKTDDKFFLLDFGLFKEVRQKAMNYQGQDAPRVIAVDSEGFMPAEQIGGQTRYSSDLYALGMILIQMLTGLKPHQLRQNQINGEWIWQSKIPVTTEFKQFVDKMVRFDFRHRFPTAIEALNALKLLNVPISKFKPDDSTQIGQTQAALSHSFLFDSDDEDSETEHSATLSMESRSDAENESVERPYFHAQNSYQPKFKSHPKPPSASFRPDKFDFSQTSPFKILFYAGLFGAVLLMLTFSSMLSSLNNASESKYKNVQTKSSGEPRDYYADTISEAEKLIARGDDQINLYKSRPRYTEFDKNPETAKNWYRKANSLLEIIPPENKNYERAKSLIEMICLKVNEIPLTQQWVANFRIAADKKDKEEAEKNKTDDYVCLRQTTFQDTQTGKIETYCSEKSRTFLNANPLKGQR